MLTESKTEIAKNYLKVSAFSREGLVRQLEFDGFSHEEAVCAADNCQADWNEQALKAAENYRSIIRMSAYELINELQSDGFTKSEAIFGAVGRF